MIAKRTLAKYFMFLVIAAPALAQLYGNTVGYPVGDPSDKSEPKLVITKHAKCRMACRHVSLKDVEKVLADGEMNLKKSDPDDRPCPSFAYEGLGQEGEKLRVVLANCASESRVVTVINLERKFNCSCS